MQWFAERYHVPPNHPLVMQQSASELLLLYYEHLWRERAQLLTQMEKNADAVIERLNALNEVLGERTESVDPLIDEWERELAEGRIPDLER